MNRPSSRLARLADRVARLGLASLLAASLVLTLAQQARTVGPWWLELSRYLPYPVLLAPGGLALAASFALGRRWIVASLATLAFVATLGAGLAWGRPDAGARPLRVMSYNIKAYKAAERPGGFAALLREVERHAPDVLLVQDNQGAIRHAEAPIWPAGRPFGLPYGFRADQYIVASRHPLRDCVLERLDPVRPTSAAVRCTVDVDGRALTVVDVHFDSPREGLNATRRGADGVDDWEGNYLDRLWQARLLAAVLRPLARPLIVAGDLNAPEPSQVVRTLKATGLRDAFSSAMRGYGYTYGHALRVGFSFLRIDHVLVSPDLGVAACEVGGSDASDHRPVIVDLRLERRPAPEPIASADRPLSNAESARRTERPPP